MERQPAAAVLVDTDSLDSVTVPLPHLVIEEAPPSRTGVRVAPCDLLTVPAAASGAGSGNAATDSEEDELEADLSYSKPDQGQCCLCFVNQLVVH